ncbi:MAG TPA: MarR family transcriptional regulator [Candidatus Flavonifractor merdigallinarum]|uniref:MarR family transcriptional regulator n=1 Tax=Candidatus Flavonifractor merdigallinarum TaxID=2838589 RepID=A0A9D1Y8T0_9FIRM|nr:MarR family transcriptional regulator [Candidatus Flavonifractor merdigallinarum]
MERTFHMLLYRAFHAQRSRLQPCLRELGLGPGQPKLLSYLSTHGPCRQRELADYFEIDPAAVCRMLDVLEKGGFVSRQPEEGSRRCDLFSLTTLGQAATAAWKRRSKEVEELALTGFSPEERAQFSAFLQRAYHNLHTGGGSSHA